MLGLGLSIPQVAIRRSGGGGGGVVAGLPLDAATLTSGHSLTDFPMPTMLQRLVEAAGGPGIAGAVLQSIRPSISIGSSMEFRWNNDGLTTPFQARAQLTASWPDTFLITEAGPLYPPRLMSEAGGSFEQIALWFGAAFTGGVQRFHLYEIWPSVDLDPLTRYGQGSGTANLDAWRLLILQDQARWEALHAHADAQGAVPDVYLLPVGQAIAALYDAHKEAPLDGITNFHPDLFHPTQPDFIHPNNKLAYFIGCCWYAALYRRSPVGLAHALLDQYGTPFPNMPSAALALKMQQVAWAVVSTHPLAGIVQTTTPVLTYVGWGVGAELNRVQTPGVGSLLTAHHYATGYPRPTVSYEWLVNGAVSGTGSTFTVPASAGAALSLRATPSAGSPKTSPSQTITATPTPHNIMLNSALIGTALGSTQTAGNMPDFHDFELNSAIQVDITGSGTMSAGGATVPYIQYRLYGTASSYGWWPSINLSTHAALIDIAQINTAYHGSAYVQKISGGTLTARLILFQDHAPYGNEVAGPLETITTTPELIEVDLTTNANNPSIRFQLRIDSVTNGSVHDVVFRVIGERLQKGAASHPFLATKGFNPDSVSTPVLP